MEAKNTFVRKLDIESQFNEIKTGVKSISGLKHHEQTRYSVWYNYFRDRGALKKQVKSDIAWVGNHWKQVFAYLNETYKEGNKSTYRNHIESLANVLLSIDKDKFKEIVRPFFNSGLDIQKRLDLEKKEQSFTDREEANFVAFEDLVKMRDKLYTQWRADPSNLKLNMNHLILAVNTYIPPLRLNFIDMEFFPNPLDKKKATGEPPKDVKTNYLWERKPGSWSIVLNYDKIENKRVAKKQAREIFDLDDEIPGVTEGDKLNKIIDLSLKFAPREYVLIGIRTKAPMTVSGYDHALSAMFAPLSPRQNLIRKAYINYWHRAEVKGKELNLIALEAIAKRMRHTVGVALQSYKKIMPKKKPELAKIVEEVVEKPVIKIPIVVKKTKFFDAAAYSKAYRKKNAAKIKEKKKSPVYKKHANTYKILWYLNHKVTTNPTKASIEKHGLKQNEDGQWSSTLE